MTISILDNVVVNTPHIRSSEYCQTKLGKIREGLIQSSQISWHLFSSHLTYSYLWPQLTKT